MLDKEVLRERYQQQQVKPFRLKYNIIKLSILRYDRSKLNLFYTRNIIFINYSFIKDQFLSLISQSLQSFSWYSFSFSYFLLRIDFILLYLYLFYNLGFLSFILLPYGNRWSISVYNLTYFIWCLFCYNSSTNRYSVSYSIFYFRRSPQDISSCSENCWFSCVNDRIDSVRNNIITDCFFSYLLKIVC